MDTNYRHDRASKAIVWPMHPDFGHGGAIFIGSLVRVVTRPASEFQSV